MSKLFVDEIVHQSSQGSGTITLGASGETIQAASGTQNNIGIGASQAWKLSSDISNPAKLTDNVITNWTSIDSDQSFGQLGSLVSESSGIFSFSETGIYRVDSSLGGYVTGGSSHCRLFATSILVTTNNSTYNLGMRGYTSITYVGTNTFNGRAVMSYLLDVTDTTNVKCKIANFQDYTGNFLIYSGERSSNVIFTRLGDT